MNVNAGITLTPTQHLESRHVLAGAYAGRGRRNAGSNTEDRTLLTHSVIVDADGTETRTLCGFDKDRLADVYSASPEEAAAPPTCPRCLKVWDRLQRERRGAERTEFGICDYCKEDLRRTDRAAATIATMRKYNRAMNLCAGCGDLACETVTLPPATTPNPRFRGPRLTEGDDDANRRRGSSGRFQKSTMCDFCGKSCAAQHFTDDRLEPGSDGPGFYLCGRPGCVKARERLEATQGFPALAAHYTAQRKKNDSVRREAPAPRMVDRATKRDERRAALTPEGAIELCESNGHQMSPWEGRSAHCIKCGQTVSFDPVFGASGPAWYRGSKCVQTPNGRHRDESAFILSEIAPGLSATRLSSQPSKMFQGRPIETWKVHPSGSSMEPVAQIQLFMDKDRRWASWSVMPRDRVYGKALEAARNGARLVPNASYYVWVIGRDNVPLSEGPYGPHDLEGAKTFARISATEGGHDRAVSRGLDPEAADFTIVRRYERGTGRRLL